MKLRFQALNEPVPGDRWTAMYHRLWPLYREWFLQEGEDARPDLAQSRAKLEEYMPELVPLWERLTQLAGGGEETARMLSLYRPTPYLSGCSQAVWTRGAPRLVRNYDYHPLSCDAVILRTSWTGTRVLASTDCLWGVLDGVNEHGLAVALSLGGRRVVGDGFGIPLVLRYVLETCQTTDEASDVLLRVPSHMAYNVSLLDASGAYGVAYLAPDREATVVRSAVATNHQHEVEWTAHDVFTKSQEREEFLAARLSDPELDREAFVGAFLAPPLFSAQYSRAFGTLYTASYDPVGRAVSFLWPGKRWDLALNAFEEGDRLVEYSTTR